MLALLFPQYKTFYLIPYFAEHLERTHLLEKQELVFWMERHWVIRVCLPAWNKNCFQLYKWLYHLLPLVVMGVSGILEAGITTSCSRVEYFPKNRASQGFTNHPGLTVLHTGLAQAVQQPSCLLRHLLFRAGQNNATVFPSPSPTVQRGFKKTKDVGHHSL